VRDGDLSPLALVDRMSTAPARILDVEGGSLAEGRPADVALIDPDARWTYDPVVGFSKSRNSPWVGVELQGRVRATWVAGRRVHSVETGTNGGVTR
jgi:dihydroorotase